MIQHAYKVLRLLTYYDGWGITCGATHRYSEGAEERFDEVRFHVFVPSGGDINAVVQAYLQELKWGSQTDSYFACVEA
jgi:hypothetical protein